MVDRGCLEARLRRLRHELDSYGVQSKGKNQTWDGLVDQYDAALEEAATTMGIDPPGPPRLIGRRFTRDAREWLESALAAKGLRIR